ncbi:lipoprotein [Spiroplasma melliferum]|uniref:lipoprotein n=1 Tax=Spiroplasma melliferum TaxID=2134 RepID=UPI000C764D6C|nr:lipoprotein [Spiroplasma melliferum]
MKKILSILGTINLLWISTTSLVSCHDSNTFTEKTNDVGEWKGVSLPLNYFIKNNDNKYYAISHLQQNNWIINLFYNDNNLNKLVLEPNYKVWQWKLDTIPNLPKINKQGNIVLE